MNLSRLYRQVGNLVVLSDFIMYVYSRALATQTRAL